jgi:AcrR family transcriptional regulator
MPRNHRDVDREVKRDAIEQAAADLMLRHGYEATSMAAVADKAGVATNTVYWYFRNKDELLIAVLDRVVAEALERHTAARKKSPAQQMAWMLDEFDRAQHLVATVHTRAERSETLREWHERFHQLLEQVIVQQLMAHGMSRADAEMTATVNSYVMEGLLSHAVPRLRRDAVLRWLSAKVMAAATARSHGA